MFSVGEAMLFSLLLGALLAMGYILFAYIRMFLGGGCLASLEKMPLTLHLPLLSEKKPFPTEKDSRRIYRRILTFIIDIFYFFLLGTALSVFVYSVGGVFRISYVLLSVAGFFLFYLTVGRFFIFASPYVYLGFKVVCLYFLYVLLLPMRSFFRGTKFVFSKVRLIFRSLCDRINIEMYDRSIRRSENAFGKEWEQKIREVNARFCSEKND